MQWIDVYATMYQKANGFPVTILAKPNNKKGYLSMKPTTRAAYDLSMRENSIDGIITVDDITTQIQAGDVFFLNTDPINIYIIQTCSYWEQQPDTRNINAIKVNCLVNIQRYGFKDETSTKEEWYDVYQNVYGFISEVLKDSKNFNAGMEIATVKSVQIPKLDINKNMYMIQENDRILVSNLLDLNYKIKIQIESMDSFGVQGVIRLQGTQDIRNDNG